MDPLEEFLSPEALRLLLDSDDFATAVDEPSVTTSDQSLSIITPLAAGADTPISNESKPTRKRPSSDANITGCSTLVLGQAGLAKPKRAKFSAEGRAKVASVRKKGACMKCHRNKIPCSGKWPCESCCRSRAVIAGRASRHRWMDCVPFSMKDLNIFANEIVQNDHTVKIPFRKILESIDDVFLKLSQNEVVPSMGKKASSLFRGSGLSKLSVSIDARSTHVDRRVDECFHLAATICRDNIINTINLVYVNKDEVIWNTQSIAGSRLLQLLEKVLSNVSLAGFDADTLRTLIKILCLTMWVVNLSPPSVQSLPGFADRQQKQQLLRVLAHHTVYIGERVDLWKGLDKENVIAGFLNTIHRYGDGNAQFPPENPYVSVVDVCYSLGETSIGISTALHPRRGDTSQTTLYTEANTVSEQGNDRVIVQRNEVAKSAYLPDQPPEDRNWKISDISEIDSTISTTTADPLPEQQPDAVCGWCGSFQISYKPSQGVVSCDDCFTIYQAKDSGAPGWDFGHHQSTDQSSNPANGLDCSQGDLVDYASWPDVTASSGYGNDVDDFSWFMAS